MSDAPHPRGRSRRWTVPPALSSAAEPLEGYGILADADDDDVGTVLWQTCRDLILWARTSPAERAALFSATAFDRRTGAIAAAIDDATLAWALSTLTSVLRSEPQPAEDALAAACAAVARWAGERRRDRTQLWYLHTAAAVLPADPQAAYEVAMALRHRADFGRAEMWFRRAIGLARRKQDWKCYGLSYGSLGVLYLVRGEYVAAEETLLRALRVARRQSIWSVRATTLHEMFVLSALTGRVDAAERYARLAYSAYGRNHPRLPALAHDVGVFWMENGHFARALRVLQALLPRFSDPPSRMFALSSIARAAGGSGAKELFLESWSQCMEILGAADSDPDAENVAASLLNLALGAASVGNLARAEEAVRRAASIASIRDQGPEQRRAAAILSSLPSYGPDAARRDPEEPEDTTRSAEALSHRFVSRLTGV